MDFQFPSQEEGQGSESTAATVMNTPTQATESQSIVCETELSEGRSEERVSAMEIDSDAMQIGSGQDQDHILVHEKEREEDSGAGTETDDANIMDDSARKQSYQRRPLMDMCQLFTKKGHRRKIRTIVNETSPTPGIDISSNARTHGYSSTRRDGHTDNPDERKMRTVPSVSVNSLTERKNNHRRKQSSRQKSVKPPSDKKKRFIYGNYDEYYKVKGWKDSWHDVRVDKMDPQWFHGKKCLDVGCNIGIVSILIASQFGVSHMHGVDIDENLIAKARKHVQDKQKNDRLDRALNKNKKRYQHSSSSSSPSLSSSSSLTNGASFTLDNVTFSAEDFADIDLQLNDSALSASISDTYDVITCLSVTKWVHYHRGDHGLKLFFRKLYHSLRPSGLLILEAQPWKSYRKKYTLTKEITKVYHTIQFKPAHFEAFLTNELGFEVFRRLPSAIEAKATMSKNDGNKNTHSSQDGKNARKSSSKRSGRGNEKAGRYLCDNHPRETKGFRSRSIVVFRKVAR